MGQLVFLFFNKKMFKTRKCAKRYRAFMYSQTCVQRPPLGPEKSGRLKEGPDKSEILDWPLMNQTGRC